MEHEKLHKFESIISYVFKDMKLLIQALTHSSYANENSLKKIDNNERLEFLGDAVLEIITSDFLYKKYPNLLEGELTKIRASIVCEPTLADVAREIGLGNFLLLGKGEDISGGRNRDSVLSDAIEALLGAIYLDGGMLSAYKFIEEMILTDAEERKRFVDSKTHLQEHIQQISDVPIEYVVISESGPDHNKSFSIEIHHEGMIIGAGTGRSKKIAEQHAAFDALNKIKS